MSFKARILAALSFSLLVGCMDSNDPSKDAQANHDNELAVGLSTVPSGFSDVQVVAGLSNPTLMEIAPDGRIFISEQAGKLRVVKNGVLLPTPFVTVNVNTDGERGLLGIAFDPNYS